MASDLSDLSDLEMLPGAEIVLPGVADLEAGRPTIEAAAVLVASSRLSNAGLAVSADPYDPANPPEHVLYERIGDDPSVLDAFSRYNATLRRLDSFARALERRARTG